MRVALSGLFSPRPLLLLMLLGSLLVYWAGISLVDLKVTRGHIIGSDGLFYYEYLPSVFLDGDLDFSNQRQILIDEGVPYGWSVGSLQPSVLTGRPGTPFSIGWALLVSPFFLLARIGSVLFGSWLGLRSDGYGFLYESVSNFGAVLYGCIGVWLVFKTLRLYFEEWISALVAAATLLATNLIYYVIVQASMSHAIAFFTTAGALLYCCTLADHEPQRRSAALGFGLFAGLSFLVRPQLALSVTFMFGYLLVRGVPHRNIAWAAAVTVLVAGIQLAAWHHLFGRMFALPQGEGFLRLSDPHLLDVLFSRRHGLFVWHPLYLIFLFGLVPVGRLRWLYVLCLLCISAQIYLNAAAADWWAGNAFGNRRFIDCLPFFAVGGASALTYLSRLRASASVLAFLTVWNVLFLFQYRFGYIPRGEEVTWTQLVVDKFRLPSVPRSY